MISAVERAKKVLADDERALYGVFGLVASSDLFPSMSLLNEFLSEGYDPCDQDGRMASWAPFSLSTEEFENVKSWWRESHPNTKEDALGATSWNEWVQAILNREG